MRAFKLIGVLLLIGLAAWTIDLVFDASRGHPTPQVLALGSAFEGNLQLPADTIKGYFDKARTRMFSINSTGQNLRIAGDVGGWLAFAATAIITLIVGFFGRAPAADGAATQIDGLPARSVRFIGFLAALAAVLTAVSNLGVAKSQDYFKRADQARDLIIHARQQVIDAKNPESAQAVLDDLILKLER
jgi:hypothetical protein